MHNFVSMPFSTKYESKIRALADETLGLGYLDEEEIVPLRAGQSKHKSIMLIDPVNDNVVGFCFFDIRNYKETQFITKNMLDERYAHETFGHLKTMCISPKYQGLHIGTSLMRECIDTLSRQGIKMLYTTIWDKPQNRANVKMMTRCGFHEVKVIPEYWEEESRELDYDCPICGHPCHCNCIIMTNFD